VACVAAAAQRAVARNREMAQEDDELAAVTNRNKRSKKNAVRRP
jgi:hypothetical protein